jgi:hypothetical protein
MKAIAICAILAVLICPSVTGFQKGFPLVCRGGGDLHFTYTPFSNLSQQPQIWITFERALGAAGANWENITEIQPGQCTWLDRPVSQDEPNQIALLNVRHFSIQWQRGQVAGISSELAHINTLLDSNRYQSFEVNNNGNGFFIVSAIGRSDVEQRAPKKQPR